MDISYSEGRQYHTLDDLPERYRNIFSSYPSFNVVQSRVFDNIFQSKKSLVVAAPTGSGKTVILELAVVKVLMDLEKNQFRNDFKIIYISPVKALCRERFNDWNPRFSSLGISCAEITGDGDDYFDLRGSNVIITTPEKWDSLTRKWRDNASLVQLVKLFLIDEVHLLSDNKRGPVLETIVSRMKTVSKTLQIDSVRFVAVSATIYNVEDLAFWLGNDDGLAHCHKFRSDVRPVQLQKIVRGYNSPPDQSAFLFDIQLSYKLKALILEHSKGKPTLVFCSTRKSVIQTSKILSEQLTFHFTDKQRRILCESSSTMIDNKLRELVVCGIGFHHAGVPIDDRHIIQDLFRAGSLPILVATSTLAMGVNLPAHLVIIKCTQQYIAGRVEEYSESSVLQMIGRAGRPQFDTTATAIIMTKNDLVKKYEKLLDSKEIIESNLHHHLPEHLNSEIVLLTITDLGVAMEWIRSTYLYVRALKNPKHYGFGADANRNRVEKYLENICIKEINGLKNAELINVSEDGIDISPTPYGRLMSHYYLSFETFKILLSMKGTETVPEILTALSEAHEFTEVQLRASERRTLNELNKSRTRETIRFPLKGKVKNRSMKVNCLIQACLGCLTIQDPALYSESIRIVRLAERLCKCLSDILSKKEHYATLLHTVVLAKCLHAKLWENSPFVCRQLERIGPALGALLASCGKTSFIAIEEANPRDLERILNRAPPFGNVLQEAVHHLPKYALKLENERINTLTFRTIVTVSLLNPDVVKDRNTAGIRHWITLVVGDTDNKLRNFSRLTDQTLIHRDFQVSIVSRYPKLPHKVIANLVSDQWVGIDVTSEIVVVAIAENSTTATKTPAKRKRKNPESSQNPRSKVKPKVESKAQAELNYFKQLAEENGLVSRGFVQGYEKSEQPFECCFDVDIVNADDISDTEPSATNSGSPSKSHDRFFEPLIEKFCANFAEPQFFQTSVHNTRCDIDDDIPNIVFESLEQVCDHLRGVGNITDSNSAGKSPLDSGYFSSSAPFPRESFLN